MDPMCGHSLQTGNISGMLSDNRPRPPLRILYITPEQRIVAHMKQIFFPFCIALLVGLGGPAMAADCYADYKAKQDNPLRLHYGVAKVTGPAPKLRQAANWRNGWVHAAGRC